MDISKNLEVRLYFNLADRTFYLQLGKQMYFRISDKVCTAIQEKEGIEIVHVSNVKEMQNKSNND